MIRAISILTTTIIIFFAISIPKISAQSDLIESDLTFQLNIAENVSTANINLNITNTHPSNLLTAYELFVPYVDIVNLAASVNGEPVGANFSMVNNTNSSLYIDLSSKILKSSESANLNISFDVLNNTKDFLGTKYASIPKILNLDSSQNTLISFPSTFGKPSIISNSNFTETIGTDNFKYEFGLDRNVMLAWGNNITFDVSSKINLVNLSSSFYTLIPLPLDTQMQDVSYKSINGAILAFIDSKENIFAATNSKSETTDFLYVSKIKKTNGINNLNNKFTHTIDLDSALGSSISSYYNQVDTNAKKLFRTYEYLINEYEPSIEGEIFRSFDQIQLSTNKSQNSLFYASVLASVANQLGFETNIVYGYAVLGIEGEGFNPHFWVQVSDNENAFIVDPYLADLTNTDYFGLNTELDRILFGQWSFDDSYNSALGIVNNKLVALELTKIDDIESENEIFANLNQNQKIFSGFYNTIYLKITNLSAKILPVNSIYIDNLLVNTFMNESGLNVALLPRQSSLIPIEYREPNFFKTGVFDKDFRIEFAQNQVIDTGSISLEFKVDTKTVWFIVGLFNFILVGIAYISWRFVLK